jgi:hypothetical protein
MSESISKAHELVFNINETINTAILLEGAYEGGFLLVEGDSDIKFWAKFIEKKYLIKADGKYNVIAAANILDAKEDQQVIGVVDADFDRVNNVDYSNRIVLTDGHDLEILMLHSNALAQVKLEYFDSNKCQEFEARSGKPLLDAILEHASIFGVLRHLHIQNKCTFSFDEFNPYRYEDKSTFDFNYTQLKVDFCSLASIDPSQINNHIQLLTTYSKQEVCQGHDTLKIICIMLRKMCKPNSTKAISDEDLAKFLRMAFSKEDLLNTTMFQTLKQKAEAWNLNMLSSCS